MNHTFITGTDTDIGKTLVSALLLKHRLKHDPTSTIYKPVQTGGRALTNGWASPDIDTVLTLTGHTLADPSAHCTYCYEPACSPHLAAAESDQPIDIHHIHSSFNALANTHNSIIVEGAGGVAVPLGPEHTMIDLMVLLDLPIVLVSRPNLGTLNHTLLSTQVLRAAGLTIQAIVINSRHAGEWTHVEHDNIATLAVRTDIPLLASIPYSNSLQTPADLDALYAQVEPQFVDIFPRNA